MITLRSAAGVSFEWTVAKGGFHGIRSSTQEGGKNIALGLDGSDEGGPETCRRPVRCCAGLPLVDYSALARWVRKVGVCCSTRAPPAA